METINVNITICLSLLSTHKKYLSTIIKYLIIQQKDRAYTNMDYDSWLSSELALEQQNKELNNKVSQFSKESILTVD